MHPPRAFSTWPLEIEEFSLNQAADQMGRAAADFTAMLRARYPDHLASLFAIRVIVAVATCGELVSANNQGHLRERAPSGNGVVARVLTVSTPEIYRSDLQAFMPHLNSAI